MVTPPVDEGEGEIMEDYRNYAREHPARSTRNSRPNYGLRTKVEVTNTAGDKQAIPAASKPAKSVALKTKKVARNPVKVAKMPEKSAVGKPKKSVAKNSEKAVEKVSGKSANKKSVEFTEMKPAKSKKKKSTKPKKKRSVGIRAKRITPKRSKIILEYLELVALANPSLYGGKGDGLKLWQRELLDVLNEPKNNTRAVDITELDLKAWIKNKEISPLVDRLKESTREVPSDDNDESQDTPRNRENVPPEASSSTRSTVQSSTLPRPRTMELRSSKKKNQRPEIPMIPESGEPSSVTPTDDVPPKPKLMTRSQRQVILKFLQILNLKALLYMSPHAEQREAWRDDLLEELNKPPHNSNSEALITREDLDLWMRNDQVLNRHVDICTFTIEKISEWEFRPEAGGADDERRTMERLVERIKLMKNEIDDFTRRRGSPHPSLAVFRKALVVFEHFITASDANPNVDDLCSRLASLL